MAGFRKFLAVLAVLFWHAADCPWGAAEASLVVEAKGPGGEPVELPPPPPALAGLLADGDVSFSLYDPQQQRREYAGETKLDLHYNYRSTSRWNSRREAGKQIVTVYPTFHEFELKRRHTIWLPLRMADENFYNHPLVQHEFDHVRISTDPRFEKQFQSWLETEMSVLELTLPADQALDNAWIQAEVKAATRQRFDRMLELIQIRYRELDRVTDHGLHPLPESFFAAPTHR